MAFGHQAPCLQFLDTGLFLCSPYDGRPVFFLLLYHMSVLLAVSSASALGSLQGRRC